MDIPVNIHDAPRPEQVHTILIVDDTPANLETLYRYFENLGFEIMMAQSGAGALRRVEYVQPDIILLDVVMPGMDGYEACRRLKANERTRHIPIIFMTALADTVNKVRGFEVGAADYITKPFQIEEVLARVRTHLELHGLQKQMEAQNERLQREALERARTAEALQEAKDELEQRVQQRTADLAWANRSLEAEIVERRQAEDAMRRLAAELAGRIRKRNDELAALYEVTALAGESTLELNDILDHALRSATLAAQGSCGTIHLADEEQTPATYVGFDSRQAARDFGDAAAAWIIDHGEPLHQPEAPSSSPVAGLPVGLPGGFIGVPIRVNGRVLGALSVLCPADDEPQAGPDRGSLLKAIADHIGIVIESIRLRRRAEQAATLEERNRLARELHDSVTQLMYSVNLFAKASKDAYGLSNNELGERYLVRLQESARQALKELRLLLFELRPPQLEQEGLIGALQLRLDAVEGRAGVQTKLLVNVDRAIPAAVEEDLYAIAQEALNNALKHSNATVVTILLQATAGILELAIEDDGVGFSGEDEPGRRGGMGLTTMRERARQLGGELTIDTGPETGTAVRLRLALPPAETEEET